MQNYAEIRMYFFYHHKLYLLCSVSRPPPKGLPGVIDQTGDLLYFVQKKLCTGCLYARTEIMYC